ncbi:hypothetical protein F4778DRAFT_529891 [Xylariomycetidae sp. FL2044]|nr:hypothetical protein F4778DRAFT_529891 [Xylariomycetidae sp. FL2044]
MDKEKAEYIKGVRGCSGLELNEMDSQSSQPSSPTEDTTLLPLRRPLEHTAAAATTTRQAVFRAVLTPFKGFARFMWQNPVNRDEVKELFGGLKEELERLEFKEKSEYLDRLDLVKSKADHLLESINQAQFIRWSAPGPTRQILKSIRESAPKDIAEFLKQDEKELQKAIDEAAASYGSRGKDVETAAETSGAGAAQEEEQKKLRESIDRILKEIKKDVDDLTKEDIKVVNQLIKTRNTQIGMIIGVLTTVIGAVLSAVLGLRAGQVGAKQHDEAGAGALALAAAAMGGDATAPGAP